MRYAAVLIALGSFQVTCASHEATDPCEVAANVANYFANHPLFYLLPDIYGAALDFKSLYESHETFSILCSSWPKRVMSKLDMLLNTYERVPFTSAWIETHNRSVIAWDDAIGDTRGLFPVVYLDRMEYYKHHPEDAPKSYKPEEDLRIAVGGAKDWILPFPGHLPDGTLARRSGGLAWPKAKEATYLWADDQFMGLNLVTRLAEATLEEEWLHQLTWAVEQLRLFESHLVDPADSLYAHGFNEASDERSCCKWGRANGWGLMARAEVLKAFDTLTDANITMHGQQNVLKAFESHATAMLKAQSEDGRWHQVVNDTDTFLESSGTAMTVFAFARGVARGWLPASLFANAARRGWEALAKQVTHDGKVKGICIPTNILESTDAYNKRPTFPFLSIEGGVGAVLRAAVAMSELEAMKSRIIV